MSDDPKPTQEFDYVLPKIVMGETGSPPKHADVQKMYTASRANRERVIEWPWKAGSKSYALIVVYPFVRDSNWWDYERKDDPVWKIVEEGVHGNPVRWQYKSSDVTLAAEMVGMIDAEAAGGSASAGDTIELTATLVFDDWITKNYQELHVGIGQAAPQLVYGYLQNLQAAYFTGKVVLGNRGERAEVFFEGGVPVHATTGDLTGDAAIEEIVSWQVSTFESFPNQSAEVRTVVSPLSSPINRGISLLEQKRYLAALALTFESGIARVGSDATQAARSQLTGVAKAMYDYLENESSLTDMLRDLLYEDRDWVPAMLYLLQSGLIEVKPPGAARSRFSPSAINIDDRVKVLFSAQTGVYSYRALLLYLQREYHRFQLMKTPVSLIVFDLKLGTAKTQKAAWLPPAMVKVLSKKLDWLKRPADTFAHFETLDYAILLPNTSLKQATSLAKRLVKVLSRYPLANDQHSGGLTVHCGVAGLPANGDTLEHLIDAARAARDHAKTAHITLVVGGQVPATPEPAQAAAPAGDELRVVTHAVTTNIDATRLTYTDLLFRAGQLTPDQLKEANDLVAVMRVPLPLGRVLAMEGHIEERTVDAAIEVEARVKAGKLTLDQAMKALTLVGSHDFDLETALRRLSSSNTAEMSKESHALGQLLVDAGVVQDWMVSEALHHSKNSGLPLGTVMVCNGMISRYSRLIAIRLQRLVRDKVITKENAVNAWKHSRSRSVPVPQCLRDVGCAKGADLWRQPAHRPPPPAPPASAFGEKPPPAPYLTSRCDWIMADLLVAGKVISLSDYLTACEIDVIENKDTGTVLVECGLLSESVVTVGRQLVLELEAGKVTRERAVKLMVRATASSEISGLVELMREAVNGATPPAVPAGAVEVLTAAGIITERQLRAAKALSSAKQLPVESTILSSGVVDQRMLDLSLEARRHMMAGALDIEQVAAVLKYLRENKCSFAGGVAVFGFANEIRE